MLTGVLSNTTSPRISLNPLSPAFAGCNCRPINLHHNNVDAPGSFVSFCACKIIAFGSLPPNSGFVDTWCAFKHSNANTLACNPQVHALIAKSTNPVATPITPPPSTSGLMNHAFAAFRRFRRVWKIRIGRNEREFADVDATFIFTTRRRVIASASLMTNDAGWISSSSSSVRVAVDARRTTILGPSSSRASNCSSETTEHPLLRSRRGRREHRSFF